MDEYTRRMNEKPTIINVQQSMSMEAIHCTPFNIIEYHIQVLQCFLCSI